MQAALAIHSAGSAGNVMSTCAEPLALKQAIVVNRLTLYFTWPEVSNFLTDSRFNHGMVRFPTNRMNMTTEASTAVFSQILLCSVRFKFFLALI